MIKTNVSIVLLFRDNCGKATSVHQKPVCTTATTMAPVHIPVNANATKHGWETVAKLVPARTPATVRSVFFNPLPQSLNPTDQSYQSLLRITPADYFHRSILPINPTNHFCGSILPITSTDQSYRSIQSIRPILPINPTDPTELLLDTRDE